MPYNSNQFKNKKQARKEQVKRNKSSKNHKKKVVMAKKDAIRVSKAAKVKVAKAIAKENKDITKYDPEQYALLCEVARKAIIKKRRGKERRKIHSILSDIILKTPYQPIRSTTQLDTFSNEVFIRAMAEVYAVKNGALFSKDSGVSPAVFRAYCQSMTLIYLRKVGKVEGALANYIPEPNPSYRVPAPLAKWLEYICACIHMGSRQITEFLYNDDFQFNFDYIGPGDGFGTVDQAGVFTPWSYVGSQQTAVFTQAAVLQPNPANATVPADQPMYPITATAPTNLSVFMSSPGILGTVSTVLQNLRIPSVSFDWLPGMGKVGKPSAPDGSGYLALNQETPLNQYAVVNGFKSFPIGYAWLSVHNYFDAELGYLFNLSKVATTQPNINSVALPMCRYDYNAKYDTLNMMPWYIQPHYVAIHLANECDFLHRGPWKSLTMSKAHLKSFFPNPRFVGGTSFFTLVAHAYQKIQVQQNQQNTTVQNTSNPAAPILQGGYANEDQKMTNWYWLAACAAHSWQRRFNEQQVVMANCCIFNTSLSNFILPNQSNYVDSSVQDIKLPKTISAAIDDMGIIIRDGVLHVPATQYANLDASMPSPPTSTSAYGPIGWSAFGFIPNAKDSYPYENIQTMPVANVTPAALVPVAAKLDYLFINTNYVNNYLGWVAATSTLYPFFLGGQWLRKLSDQLTSFLMGGNEVNTIIKNVDRPRYPKMGKSSVMGAETLLNFQQVQVEPLLPNNLLQTAKQGLPTSTLSVLRLPIIGATSQVLDRADATLIALLESNVQDTNQPSRPDATNRVVPDYLKAYFTGSPSLNYAGSIPQGLYNVNVKSANAFTETISAMTSRVLSPDSDFAKEKSKVDRAKTHVSQLVPKSKAYLLAHLNTDKAYRGEAAALTESAFGEDLQPNISGNDLKGAGKVPDAAAGNVAIIQSMKGVTSDEGSSDPTKSEPKEQAKKVSHKHLKEMSDALDKAGKAAGKAMDAMTKVVGTAAQTVEDGANSILGAFAL